MSTPVLRFQQFSGEWTKKRLGDLVTFYKGRGLSKEDLSIDGVPCIHYGELYITYGGIIETVFSKTDADFNNPVVGMENDILIPASGETAIDIATASTLKVDGVLIGGDINLLRPIKGICGGFISYQIRGVKKRQLAKYAEGASIVHLYKEGIKSLQVFLPTLEEQQKISSFFSLIDKKIEMQQEKIEQMELFKKGMMQKIFSREIRFKDEDGKEFPEWNRSKLGDLGVFISGYGFPEKYQGHKNFEIPFYKVSDMNIEKNQKYMVESNHTVSRELMSEMKLKAIENPAIIFAKVGAAVFLERKRIVEHPFLIDNNMMAYIPNKDKTTLLFTYYLLNTVRLSRYAQVGALPSYNGSDLSSIAVKIPTLREQEKLSIFMSSIDLKLEKEIAKLNSLIELKKGFLYEMFV